METKSIDEKIEHIKSKVGDAIAINALSGGVDSSVVTFLGKMAIGNNLKTYFINTGFMREREPETVWKTFKDLGIEINIINEEKRFLEALKGITDGEEKRKVFSDTFYKIFGRIIKKEGAIYLFQGTIEPDKIMFDKGQSQHNVRTKSDYSKFGIEGVIEPLFDLYKNQVREIAIDLNLPDKIYNRQPFPGPGLLIRVLGEATKERIEIVRKAQKIVEEELLPYNPSQCLACLANDTATGMIGGKASGKYMIFVRAVKTKDFMAAESLFLGKKTIAKIAKRIPEEIPNVARVLYEITGKPPATIEYI